MGVTVLRLLFVVFEILEYLFLHILLHKITVCCKSQFEGILIFVLPLLLPSFVNSLARHSTKVCVRILN